MKLINTKTISYALSISTILLLSGCDSSAITSTIPTQATGELPIANTGADMTVEEVTNITLDASGSSDPDGTIVSYEWQTQSGEGVSNTEPTLSLGSLKVGSYTAILLVTDNDGNTATDTIIITVVEKVTEKELDTEQLTENKPPVANAGADQNIVEGDDLHLNGSSSSDSDGVISKYEWYESTSPTTTILGETVTITGLKKGKYTITLKVTDNSGNWSEDNMIGNFSFFIHQRHKQV